MRRNGCSPTVAPPRPFSGPMELPASQAFFNKILMTFQSDELKRVDGHQMGMVTMTGNQFQVGADSQPTLAIERVRRKPFQRGLPSVSFRIASLKNTVRFQQP